MPLKINIHINQLNWPVNTIISPMVHNFHDNFVESLFKKTLRYVPPLFPMKVSRFYLCFKCLFLIVDFLWRTRHCMHVSEGVLITYAIAWSCGVVGFEEMLVLSASFFAKFWWRRFSNWRGTLRLPHLHSSSVILGTTADTFFIFALLREWNQPFLKIK